MLIVLIVAIDFTLVSTPCHLCARTDGALLSVYY